MEKDYLFDVLKGTKCILCGIEYEYGMECTGGVTVETLVCWECSELSIKLRDSTAMPTIAFCSESRGHLSYPKKICGRMDDMKTYSNL